MFLKKIIESVRIFSHFFLAVCHIKTEFKVVDQIPELRFWWFVV
jgi:hypothetical protein